MKEIQPSGSSPYVPDLPLVATPAEPAPHAAGANQAYHLLHVGFVAAPALAGIDKFMNLLCDWEDYLAPQVAERVDAGTFMRAVGVVEIAAAALVAVRPRLGGLVVAAWMTGIIGNLLMGRKAYDVALRDLGLAIGALALSRLSR